MWSQNEQDPHGSGIRAGWVRRRYVVGDGYIQPVQNISPTYYNPFDSYYGAGHPNASGRSLYLDLVELDTEDEASIEGFTSKWGLLGLLQDSIVQVRHVSRSFDRGQTLPYCVTELIEMPGVGRACEDVTQLEPVVFRESARELVGPDAATAWSCLAPSLQQELIDHGYAQPGGPVRRLRSRRALQELLDRWHVRQFEAWEQQARFPNGSVLVRRPTGVIEEIDRDTYYAGYFPHGFPQLFYPPGSLDDETHSYATRAEWGDRYMLESLTGVALLSSPHLWSALCEPLDAFRAAVKEFQALFHLCAATSGSPPLEHSCKASLAELRKIVDRTDLRISFNRQLKRISPALHSTPAKSFTWDWSFPSLLSAAYAMLFLDFVAENRKLRLCASETCGRSFVTDRSDRKYCSDTCQNAQKQREFRRARKLQAESIQASPLQSSTPRKKGSSRERS